MIKYKNKNKEPIWFKFSNHVWRKYEIGIMKAVPNCVGKDINDAIELANDSTELLELHKFLYEKRDDIVKYVSNSFQDNTFINKLDNNEHLIPFTNGVYDEYNNEFRDGFPEDFLFQHINIPFEQYKSIMTHYIEDFKKKRNEMSLSKIIY